jgi:A/G-specific adenine glycosylase
VNASHLQTDLLHWFPANARDLPWRRTRDPYQILVSEIMLQQTQVDRVIPKYHAFLEAFPTVAALAAAPTAEVIRLWAGLGYNRRAVNLQRTAQTIMSAHGGVFPRSVAELLQLPGIGPYTAGAVACFAFEQDVTFMDTNIRRVLRRALADPAADPTDRGLLTLGEQVLPPGDGWRWNQAIMELGALICTAANPDCLRCPINAHCADYAARKAADTALVLAMGEPRPLQRAAERKANYKPEAPFKGSNRWYRGRIVAALRSVPPGASLSFDALGPQVKPDYQATDAPWLRTLVQGLVRDGLALVDADLVRLP